ncbi:hypothetical protein CC85DRAFT_331266 [Cutaneotrichosporon oleaginosum]|uniref:Uncharacterized protein n=1 Tax=Cutaneotrichosporon oleaginosum TaxID=879819 RepID=A0A0J0XCM5_9TREE|nr:uncharacterized protein CC85DRAFT_331266 [Cutaneotrichosporon oleaginosum]KLT38820.1 hypothetical protein CC85DRAFT_331266 [Cutaneotrichosporon oleaginosum]TXT04735.1 hypothetical protein COLE_07554 [Cutaneotrichosporon oleaginosum]
MPDSNSLRDLRRAKNSAPSQGWQGPRTKWSGARENSTSYVDPPPPASPSGSTSANPYASSGPYASALHQQNVASGATDAGHSRTRDASSRFAERYAGQRSYSADPVAAVADQPKRGNSWSSWLGGKEKTEPAHSRTSSSNSPTPDKPRGSHDDDRLPERPRRGRYIPPSERKPGDPMFEPVAPPPRRGPRTSDPEDDEPDPDDNSWGAWAARQTKAANAMMQTASEKLNEGWDSVNDAGKRDKALTSVGNGAAKAAGTAVKYTAKGIWNVGKSAMK